MERGTLELSNGADSADPVLIDDLVVVPALLIVGLLRDGTSTSCTGTRRSGDGVVAPDPRRSRRRSWRRRYRVSGCRHFQHNILRIIRWVEVVERREGKGVSLTTDPNSFSTTRLAGPQSNRSLFPTSLLWLLLVRSSREKHSEHR